jgi:hypothetical protein
MSLAFLPLEPILFHDRLDDVGPLDHRAEPYITAGQFLGYRPDDGVSNHAADHFEVSRGERVLIHEGIHGRVDESGCRWCKRTEE